MPSCLHKQPTFGRPSTTSGQPLWRLKSSCLHTALGALVSEARTIFGTALLSARGFSCVSQPLARGVAPMVHAWACYILGDGLASFATLWHWSESQIALLAAQLSLLVQQRPWSCPAASGHPFMVDLTDWHGPASDYPAIFCVVSFSCACSRLPLGCCF